MDIDRDVEQMNSQQLVAEVRKLRQGIRVHRDSSGQGLCWHHPKLWGLLPEQTDPLPTVPTGRNFCMAACNTVSRSMRKCPTRRARKSDIQSREIGRIKEASLFFD